MSISPIANITRAATRKEGEPLNILCNSIHEAYQTSISKCNANFYIFQHPHCKKWNTTYRPLPPNFIQLKEELKQNQIPPYVDFDLVLIESVFGHFQIMKPIADAMHVPTLRLEHTSRMPWWDDDKMRELKNLKADTNVFISAQSRSDWWFEEDALVIEHGIDTQEFCVGAQERVGGISVANDFKNRGNILGFEEWKYIVKDLPIKLLGATPGISNPAGSVGELVSHYQSALAFVNTSIFSPIPMSLLEAAACGCAIISTATCAIPDIFTHADNAFLSNDPQELRGYFQHCLAHPEVAIEMGKKARKVIEDRFGLERFVGEWNEVFIRAASVPYLGVT